MSKKRQDEGIIAARKPPSGATETPEDAARRRLIGKTIREHRRSRGWTLHQLQERSKINNGNLSKIENGIQSLSNKTMQALADSFGVSIADLFETESVPTRAFAPQTGRTEVSTDCRVRSVGEYSKLVDIPENNSVAVGVIEVHPDAGSGEVVFTRNDRIAHLFHGGTIARIDAEPTCLVSFEVPDDTMAPRLYPEDVVVIDLNNRSVPMNGGVFAIVLDGETVCIRKLLPFINRGLRVICDNKIYPEMTLNGAQAASIYIAGRIRSMRGNGGF